MNNAQTAKIIKDLCKRKGITAKTMLEECEINRGFIYCLEKENKTPSADKIVKIADYFNVSTDYILGRTDNPEINK